MDIKGVLQLKRQVLEFLLRVAQISRTANRSESDGDRSSKTPRCNDAARRKLSHLGFRTPWPGHKVPGRKGSMRRTVLNQRTGCFLACLLLVPFCVQAEAAGSASGCGMLLLAVAGTPTNWTVMGCGDGICVVEERGSMIQDTHLTQAFAQLYRHVLPSSISSKRLLQVGDLRNANEEDPARSLASCRTQNTISSLQVKVFMC